MLQNPNPVIHEKLENTEIYEQYLKKRQQADPSGADEFDALESSIIIFDFRVIISSLRTIETYKRPRTSFNTGTIEYYHT